MSPEEVPLESFSQLSSNIGEVFKTPELIFYEVQKFPSKSSVLDETNTIVRALVPVDLLTLLFQSPMRSFLLR